MAKSRVPRKIVRWRIEEKPWTPEYVEYNTHGLKVLINAETVQVESAAKAAQALVRSKTQLGLIRTSVVLGVTMSVSE